MEMIVIIYIICFIIGQFSLPTWQKEFRNITYQVIKAMKEVRNNETASG